MYQINLVFPTMKNSIFAPSCVTPTIIFQTAMKEKFQGCNVVDFVLWILVLRSIHCLASYAVVCWPACFPVWSRNYEWTRQQTCVSIHQLYMAVVLAFSVTMHTGILWFIFCILFTVKSPNMKCIKNKVAIPSMLPSGLMCVTVHH